MQLENHKNFRSITKIHYRLSDAMPIMGSSNLHPERHESDWDMHYGLEFGLVLSGRERRHYMGNYRFDARPGQVWFCGMWEPHGWEIMKAPTEVIVLKLWPPLLTQMHFEEAPDFCALAPFIAPPERRPQTPERLRKTMLEFGGRLRKILAADSPHRLLRVRLILQEILLSLCETWPERRLWHSRRPSTEFPRINRALQMVFESRKFVTTNAVARFCGMNRHAFSALFEDWMNIRFSDFALCYRLSAAALQLKCLNEPIKSIAIQWGFSDPSHFCRLFERHYGCSPYEYREQVSREQTIESPLESSRVSHPPRSMSFKKIC